MQEQSPHDEFAGGFFLVSLLSEPLLIVLIAQVVHELLREELRSNPFQHRLPILLQQILVAVFLDEPPVLRESSESLWRQDCEIVRHARVQRGEIVHFVEVVN